MTAPFALAAALLTPAATPHVASILEAFRQADAEALQVLPTILDGLDPEGPMTELVGTLVPRLCAGEWMWTSHIVMVARDIKDAAAARERDMDMREVSRADHNAAFARWEAAYDLYYTVMEASDAAAKRGT